VSGAWSQDPQFTRAQALSLTFHVLVLTLLVTPLLPEFSNLPVTRGNRPFGPVTLSSSILSRLSPGVRPVGGGAGGANDPIPQTTGSVPKFDWNQVAPPVVRPPRDAKFEVPPTLVGPPQPDLQSPILPNWGDPNQKAFTGSAGTGSGPGIGTRPGRGIGDGDDGGLGAGRNGVGEPGAARGIYGYSYPSCLFCPRAEFTSEAVKAKIQGSVVLSVLITADGRATEIHVSHGLGFGLDEKAIEAVRAWRFKPALGPDGKPVAVRVPIEVVFHLF
jgi:periplasmic protein TonB